MDARLHHQAAGISVIGSWQPWLGLTVVLTDSAEAWGHSSSRSGSAWWTNWTFSPTVISGLALVTGLYLVGHFGRRRAAKSASRQLHLFGLAIAVLIISLLSPVDFYSDSLAWVHMLQHTLIMMVAAPIFAMSAPSQTLKTLVLKTRGKDSFVRRSLVRLLTYVGRFMRVLPTADDSRTPVGARAVMVLAVYAIVLWIWHWPVLYESALQNELVHDIQHFSFFIFSYLFWSVVIDPAVRPRLGAATGVLYLFVSSLHAMVLGVLMALAPQVWYPHYHVRPLAYGWDPLTDQQLAGLIMWMPAGSSYWIVAVGLLLRLFKDRSR